MARKEILKWISCAIAKIEIKSFKDQKSGDFNHCTEVLPRHQKKDEVSAFINHKKKPSVLVTEQSFSHLPASFISPVRLPSSQQAVMLLLFPRFITSFKRARLHT